MGVKTFTRREVLQVAAVSAAGYLAGCAVNPVSGRSELMMVSEGEEISLDRQKSPYQFSEDYGVVQDQALNRYLNDTGRRIASFSHRPNMPYSFRAVNSASVNAYAFPGGSIAATRGILVKLDNEAQLAALFGHELGHVNARHTAQQMSKGTLVQALSGGVAAVVGAYTGFGQVASQLGSLGTGALLAAYSRDNEREADALGLEYMVRAGYSPEGILGLMDLLNRESKRQPSALELMFSTHPMSRERYQAARQTVDGRYYRKALRQPVFRERYMDHTSAIRAQKAGIEEISRGMESVAKKDLTGAEAHLNAALRHLPDDYTALVIMAKVQLLADKEARAVAFADRAKAGYPQEAQAHYVSGVGNLRRKRFAEAHNDFSTHRKILPGNPNTIFYLGLSAEGMGRRDDAARNYTAYLQAVKQGEQAQYAYQRLVDWGYVKK